MCRGEEELGDAGRRATRIYCIKNIYNKNEGKKREPQLVKTQRSSEHWISSPNRHMCSIAAMFKAQKHHRRG